MNAQPTLPAAPRAHDLPPRWDGRHVEWDGWTAQIPVWVCPPPRQPRVCPHCGSQAAPSTNQGIIRLVSRRSGRTVARRLVAERCPDCRHDTVRDMRTLDVWDLDDSDYTDEGSWQR